MATERQRVDKWLWHARVVRTRSAAAALVASNHVRLNGEKIDAPSQGVKRDDVLTIALDRRVRILKVAGFAERRGDAGLAATLYEDLSPAPSARPIEPVQAVRDAGAGRPTKAERRAWSRLVDDDGY